MIKLIISIISVRESLPWGQFDPKGITRSLFIRSWRMLKGFLLFSSS